MLREVCVRGVCVSVPVHKTNTLCNASARKQEFVPQRVTILSELVHDNLKHKRRYNLLN